VTAAAGRTPKPAHLKLAGGRGNGTDSGGRVVPEPPPFKRAPPVKPDDLSPAASRMWDQVVEGLGSVDSLKSIDSFALEALCEAYARWHTAKTERLADGLTTFTSQGQGVNPLVRVEAEASREFRAWCSEFGLTPAAEMKIAGAGDDAGGDGGGLF
jgi:P27 family predicted phage terminase small subunit